MGGANLEFGRPEPGHAYKDRPAAFGVAVRDGLIALARVGEPDGEAWYGLPGGGIDPGETDAQAVVREFAEETGLIVRAGAVLDRTSQYTVSDEGERRCNRGDLMMVEIAGADASLKVEADHQLVWLPPLEAIRVLRQESHAWAVACWLRRG